MLIGLNISLRMASGTIPTLMIYGGRIMTPAVHQPDAYLIMFIATVFIGSAVATAGTLGIALAGVGLSCMALCIATCYAGAACSPMPATKPASADMTEAKP